MVETPNNRNISPKFQVTWERLSSYQLFPKNNGWKTIFLGKYSKCFSSQYQSHYLTDRFLYFYTSPTQCSFAVLLNSPAAPLHRGGKYTLAPLRNAWERPHFFCQKNIQRRMVEIMEIQGAQAPPMPRFPPALWSGMIKGQWWLITA